jgi:tripartite-type tricarboxylate transporter receptor subunit TctC
MKNLSMLCCLSRLLLVLGAVMPMFAHAQPYPVRPIRLVVPFPPGGTIDMIGRMVAQGVGERIGQTMVVDNRGGAGGIIGVELVVKSAPDGYTLCLCGAGSLISSTLMASKPPYDARRDVEPVSLVASAPYLLLVRNAPGLNSVQDLLAQAKQNPGKLNYGSAGSGSTAHLAAALFASMANINVVHVPYKGSAPAATDLFGGQIQFLMEAIAAGTQYVKTGRLRALGVSTSKRSALLPELPTIAEQGVPGYEITTWHAVAAPRGTPAAIVERLSREIAAVVQAPDTRERLAVAGVEPHGTTPAQLREFICKEFPRWDKLLTQLGLRGK